MRQEEQEAKQAVRSLLVARYSLALVTLVTVVLLGLLGWPVWRWLWGEWMTNEYYSHGLLVAPVAIYLGWRRLHLEPAWHLHMQAGDSRGLLLVAATLGIYLYFLSERAYYLAAFALVGVSAALLWSLLGLRTLRMLAFPLGYLLLMVPLPFWDRVTLPLAMSAGVSSGALVGLLGVDILIIGNAVSLPNADLVIGAQCSGVNSIIALTTLNTLVAYVLAGPWWGRIALVLLAIPIAMVGNILRITNLLWVAHYLSADAAFRFYHDYSGIIFFAIALLSLIPLAKLLQCKSLRDDVI
jgi:exosortase